MRSQTKWLIMLVLFVASVLAGCGSNTGGEAAQEGQKTRDEYNKKNNIATEP